MDSESQVDRVLAPAKINLWLHVLRRRDDGYHELDMLMQRIDLCDELEIRLDDSGEIRVDCPGLELPPGGDNLAARAARLMFGLAGKERAGCRIAIRKRIPAAGGLGGGSSDAAAVMLALNERLGLRLAKEVLIRHGVRLGADIPFFLLDVPAARARGVGEVLEPVGGLPEVWYLLVNPGVAVSTAWVFGNLGLTAPRQAAKLREFPRTTDALVRLLRNDLEAVTCSRYPQVAKAREALLDLGAAGVLMSGSGATVFGVFSDEGQVRQAGERLDGESDWQVFVARPC
ncbi:4-diphosphocytidyl-2-C-methyl-D-erythritol kinase [Geothermobacter ehrlichii]|uniref:4-diphosphocytidyl-2-C-methyl-D-erythritol kinase n=1 Tax=Geothermobacter ehrlichii TaxID=213224 RepID=A0A5D3WL01_9BACT|nr:4-(cytidine 5'-diphospho)-2-C-methyl-D-erythritol kinase [Geothermobacter ehrlichii]TYO98643.1 4-diphosphocytidyl-2-C-methyl-D-erythritol kinase [Geothermobacter ehrlichii]